MAKRAPAKQKPKKPLTGREYSASISKSESKSARVSALLADPLMVCSSEGGFQSTLNVLRDASESNQVRMAALQAIQAASFSSIQFEAFQEEYISTLRALVNDPDQALRDRVVGLLSRMGDPSIQKTLLDGLNSSEKAVVSPEKALKCLGYNAHSGVFKAARDIVANPPSELALIEALRVLGADAKSAKLLEKTLKDKSASTEVRQICAASLHALNPDMMLEYAREAVENTDEDDDVKATCLSALAHFGGKQYEGLVDRVGKIAKSKGSAVLKESAKRFLKNYE